MSLKIQTVWEIHHQRYPLFQELPSMQKLRPISQRTEHYRKMPHAEDVSGLHPHVVARQLVTSWGLTL